MAMFIKCKIASTASVFKMPLSMISSSSDEEKDDEAAFGNGEENDAGVSSCAAEEDVGEEEEEDEEEGKSFFIAASKGEIPISSMYRQSCDFDWTVRADSTAKLHVSVLRSHQIFTISSCTHTYEK